MKIRRTFSIEITEGDIHQWLSECPLIDGRTARIDEIVRGLALCLSDIEKIDVAERIVKGGE